MVIRILTTGGTFDKEYDELIEKLVFKDTHISQMLKLARSTLEINARTVMMVDSLQMTDSDREAILKQCQDSQEKQIVITHGTGTMEKTASLLQGKIQDKTIVLTGAMVQFVLGNSDGLFNLGAALALVQTLPPGVYITMNGKIYPANNVTKNTRTGIFEELK